MTNRILWTLVLIFNKLLTLDAQEEALLLRWIPFNANIDK